MITKIKIDGFKSFQDFEMIFTPLTVIAGANASGKSNLFDAFKLLARLAETDLKTAFSEQRGSPEELFTKFSEEVFSREISFTVEMLVNRMVKDNWGGEAELNNTRLRYHLKIARTENSYGFRGLSIIYESLEKIKSEEDMWSKYIIPKGKRGLWKSLRAGGSKEPFIRTENEGNATAIKIRQDGRQGGKATPANSISQTVLGGINSVDFPHAFAAKEEMRSWKFLQLNPEDLREPTIQDVGMRDIISESGKNLAGALYRIKQNDPYTLKEISRRLNQFLPNFTEVEVYDDKANRQFVIRLKSEEGSEYSSRVLSEGTLRLLVLCILEYDELHKGLICFEEPENGIHPFRVSAMVQLLKDLGTDFSDVNDNLRQVLVNTHSPKIVGKLIQWSSDRNVSVWLSRQNSLIKEEQGNKFKIRATRMVPVMKENDIGEQMELFQTKENIKLTLSEVERYLDSSDTENAIKVISE